MLKISILIGVWLVGCLVASNQIFAIEYGGIGGRPAFPRPDNPRSESIFIHDIAPQQVIHEGIKVINNTQEPKTLQVYATDETPSTDGGFACEQLSEPINDVGKWIQLEKSEVTLGSVTSEIVPFTITAPDDIDVGEHNGCIVVQEKKDKSAQAGLNVSLRTAVRVALTIPGKISKLLEITNFQLLDTGTDKYILQPTILNSGNASADANVKVLVFNNLTRSTTEFGGQYSVLLNNPLVLNYEFFKPFWGGRFTAQTIVTYNDGASDKTLESQTINFISWPTTEAVVILTSVLLSLLTVLTIWTLLVVRQKRKISRWAPYAIQSGDAVNSLAKRYHVSWKEVARVNKLKPPYELKIGQTIKLPPEK